MKDTPSVLSPKSESILRKKIWLNLLINLAIAILGVTSLYEKFFLIDGVIAFRAFTVDGNLFTTIVSIIAVTANIAALARGKESDSRTLFFLELCSSIAEAIIFLIVMLGYLPFVADTPKITPYHMFCLHVAIPVLSVFRFIFFERPQGILPPSKLILGALPIGIYGFGVVIAIKAGILPTAFVPYSFLDFEHNYLWYFLFALFLIPCFGYLCAWVFYRLNIRVSSLWYRAEDVERLKTERVRSMSRFDVVNSGMTIVFCLMPVFLLSFALMTASRTSTTIQHDLLSTLSYLMIDDYDHALGTGKWSLRDGALYKGDSFVTDGTESSDFELYNDGLLFNSTIYLKASDLAPDPGAAYDPDDYVAVLHFYEDEVGPRPHRGDVLEKNVVQTVLESESGSFYKEIKHERELTEKEEKYKEQLRNTKESYYRFVMAFGPTMDETGVGLIEMYIPGFILTAQVKSAQYYANFYMALVILIVFSLLFITTYLWIRSLEKSVDFLKILAQDEIPEKPLYLGKQKRTDALSRELNALREEKIKKKQD